MQSAAAGILNISQPGDSQNLLDQLQWSLTSRATAQLLAADPAFSSNVDFHSPRPGLISRIISAMLGISQGNSLHTPDSEVQTFLTHHLSAKNLDGRLEITLAYRGPTNVSQALARIIEVADNVVRSRARASTEYGRHQAVSILQSKADALEQSAAQTYLQNILSEYIKTYTRQYYSFEYVDRPFLDTADRLPRAIYTIISISILTIALYTILLVVLAKYNA